MRLVVLGMFVVVSNIATANSYAGICAKYVQLLHEGKLVQQKDDMFCSHMCIANALTGIKEYQGDNSKDAYHHLDAVFRFTRTFAKKAIFLNATEGLTSPQITKTLTNALKQSNVNATVTSRVQKSRRTAIQIKDINPVGMENQIQIARDGEHAFIILGVKDGYLHYVGPEHDTVQRAKLEVYADGITFNYESAGWSNEVKLTGIWTIKVEAKP